MATSRPTWNGLPNVAINKIFGTLRTGDRARMMLVSKSWKHIMSREDLPAPPEIPWQYFPSDSCFNPENSYLTVMYFRSYSEGQRVYLIKLPKFDRVTEGGWFCGSSNGWLIIAAGPKLNPDMFLWNPLTGTIRKLPPLSTLSFVPQLLNFAAGSSDYNLSNFIKRVQVFSEECIVAVVFFNPCEKEDEQNYLVFCTPHEKGWSVLHGNYSYSYSDILFDNNHDETKLYALVYIMGDDDELPKTQTDKYMIRMSNCQVEVSVMCLKYGVDVPRLFKYNPSKYKNPMFNITYAHGFSEHLVKSSSSGQLLVVTAIFDLYTYNNIGCGPVQTFHCEQTNRFEIRTIDSLEIVDSLEGQLFIVANTGSFPVLARILEADGERHNANHIIFSTDDALGGVSDKDEYVVREISSFDVEHNRLRQYSAEYLKCPVKSRTGWLIPKLYL